MKIIKIALISFIVLSVVIIGTVTVFLSTFDLNKYLEPIKAQASQALGRDVLIDHAKLDLNIFKGIGLVIDDVRIKEDASFGTGEFLRLAKLTAGVDAMAFITRREIVVTNVSLSKLAVSIIRDKDGRLNVQTIGPKQVVAEGGSTPSTSTASTAQHNAPSMPALVVKKITITDSIIHVIDQNPAMPIDMDISSINVSVNNFSLTDSFSTHVQMAVFSSTPNVELNTQARLNLLNSAVFVEGLSVKVNTGLINMDLMRKAMPILAKASLPKAISGDLVIDVPTLTASAKGIEGLNAKIVFDQGTLKLQEIPTAMTSINAQIDADQTRADIRSLTLKIGNGNVDIKGVVRDFMNTQPSYNFVLEATNLKAQEVVDPALAQMELTGDINGKAKIEGSSFDPAVAMANLKGNAEFTLTNGRLEKINIANEILGKMSQLPIVGPAVGEILTTTFNNVLKDKATEISKAIVTADINNNQVIINALSVDTNILSLTGSGQVGLSSMDVNITNKVILSKQITDELIKSIKPLSSLSNAEGLIEIPGVLSGVVPNVKYIPDMTYISKNVAKNEAAQAVGEQLDKALEKNPEVRNILNAVLGGSNNPSEGNVSGEGTAPSDPSADEQSQEQPSKKMINSIFDKILK